MKNKGLLIGGGIAALMYAAYKSWNVQESIKFFQYSISSLKVSFKNILQPQITFGIKVFNPNKTSVPLNEFFGTVKYGTNQLASFKSDGPVNINGQAEQIVTITTRVSLLNALAQLFANNSNPVVTVDGMLKTPLFDMPISKQVNLAQISGVDEEVGKLKFLRKIIPGFKRVQDRRAKLMEDRKTSFLQYKQQQAAVGFLAPHLKINDEGRYNDMDVRIISTSGNLTKIVQINTNGFPVGREMQVSTENLNRVFGKFPERL